MKRNGGKRQRRINERRDGRKIRQIMIIEAMVKKHKNNRKK